MHYPKLLLITLLLFANEALMAENILVKGRVLDSADRSALVGAVITLTEADKDSVIGSAITNTEGFFALRLSHPGRFKLTFRYLGYEPKSLTIEVPVNGKDIGFIMLKADAELLREIEVREQVRTVEQKEDTLSFNSRAYKTNPDASVEDLVRKMPGMEMRNGRLKAQGEDVQQVLVDGKPFFGDDPNIALKNLPADMVDRVEVYDQESNQSRFTGFSDGETRRTLNVVTKAQMRKGQFGKAYAGYGTDHRYNSGLTYNNFNGDRRLSMLGMANNINQQNFSAQDLVGMLGGAQSGSGRRGWGLGGLSDFIVGNENGIANSQSLGLNYSNKWKKMSEFTVSYFVNHSDIINDQRLQRILFLPADSLQFFDSDNDLTTQNLNHRFNLRMQWELDSANAIIYEPALSWQGNRRNNTVVSANTIDDSLLLNASFNEQEIDNTSLVWDNDLVFQHKFKKRGRTLSFNPEWQLQWRTSESDLVARNDYYFGQGILTPVTELLDQFAQTEFSGYSTGINVQYTEPLGDKSQLEIRLRFEEEQNLNDLITRTPDPDGNYNVLDTSLSNVFENRYRTYRAGFSYRFNTRKMNSMFGFYLQHAELSNAQEFPFADSLNRQFNNILPYGFMRYSITKGKSLRLFFRSRTRAPGIRELQEVVDNSNPLKLYKGDASLDQEVDHFLVARYTASKPEKSRTFSAFIRLRTTSNFIANTNTIAPFGGLLIDEVSLNQGTSLIRPLNLNGQRSLNSNVSLGFPIKKLKSNMNIGAGLGYERIPGLINGSENITRNTSIEPTVSLSSNISERIDFNLSYNGSYNFVANSLQNSLDNNYYNHTAVLSGNFWLGKKTVIRTDLTNSYFTGLSQGYNPNIFLWNLSLARKIFKNNSGDLRFTVFDLLEQNQSVQRNITETYVEDLENSILTRYVMLSFTYQLRSFSQQKTPEIDEDLRRQFERRGIKP